MLNADLAPRKHELVLWVAMKSDSKSNRMAVRSMHLLVHGAGCRQQVQSKVEGDASMHESFIRLARFAVKASICTAGRIMASASACLVLSCCLSGNAYCETAKELCDRMVGNPRLTTSAGEDFSWLALWNTWRFKWGYEVSGQDKVWLEEESRYYDFLISKMEREPDGYMGWIGPFYGQKEPLLVGSNVITDANLLEVMLGFSETVMRDPALKNSPLGKKAEEYIALARRTLIDKWDKRGAYYEDGMFASYLFPGVVIDKGTNELKLLPEMKISENLNKHARMGACFLKLYRITGESLFKERATKIFGHYKAIMRYHKDENRYFWNFWEPLGPFDFKPQGDNASSWVAVHPGRPGYQSVECDHFVEAYHTGVVFSEEDMRMIVNTNLWMWNKSLTDIHFKSADGSAKTPNYADKPGSDAGCLWPALTDFDPTIREINAAQLKNSKDQLEIDYFNKVKCKEAPSYKRKYVTGEIKLPDITILPSRDIIMAVAIPAHISASKGETMRLACKVHVTGPVTVSLFSADGKTFLFEIGSIDIKPYKDMFGISSITWDGKDKAGKALKGDYRVRFTLNDSTREWRIKLEE